MRRLTYDEYHENLKEMQLDCKHGVIERLKKLEGFRCMGCGKLFLLSQKPTERSKLLNQMNQPTIEQVIAHGAKIGLPSRECEKFHAYFESVGWIVGRSRKPMKSFKGAMANWKFNWQDKQEIHQKPSGSVLAIQNQSHLARIEERIKYLRGQFPLTDQKMKDQWTVLADERKRLLTALNFKA